MEEITVLIVDDKRDWTELVKLHLEKQGLNVICETNPQKVIEKYNFKDTDEIDLVISDYSIPQLNGGDLLKNIREENNEIPFIFHTSTRKENIEPTLLEEDNTKYTQKDYKQSHYNSLCDWIKKQV